MAFERPSQAKVLGDGLDAFVSGALTTLKNQVTLRNAEDESNFNDKVLTGNISLDDQLSYRQEQLKRIVNDPQERTRIRGEISSLKDRIEQKNYTDAYTQKLTDYNSGMVSIDNVISFLQNYRSSTTDQNIQTEIDKQLETQAQAKFTLQKQVISDQTNFAVNDKTASVLNNQISKVQSAKAKALLSGDDTLVASYDLQLQSLNKALIESNIIGSIQKFAAATLTGYNATALLDSYNSKIASASDASGPITIGGVTFGSEKEYWTNQRDTYVADQSANGFFSRFDSEQRAILTTKNFQNLLTPADLASAKVATQSLTARPELQNFTQQINNVQASILQNGADLKAKQIFDDFSNTYDINKAFADLNTLKNLGVNVDDTTSKIINSAGQIKDTQVSNILAAAQKLMVANPGLDPNQAVQQATAAGAGVVLSPTQLITKPETQIAGEAATAAKNETVQPDPRTTVASPQNAPAPVVQAPQPPIAPSINDLSGTYGKVGSTIYNKSGPTANTDKYGGYSSQDAFFKDAGVNSFQNIKFDEAFKPPLQNASPQLQQQPQTTPAAPTASPQTYKVLAGDTLSAISQKFLGDANRYKEIASANGISNPNQIKVGQVLNIPGK